MESTGGTRRSQDQAVYQTFFSFFGLRENPFRANPDPRYIFFSSSIRRALNELTIGSESGKSLMVLTGEAGTGKTSLINYLLASLRKQEIPVSFVFNSHLDINNLFEFILSDFGAKLEPGHNPNLRILLNQWLTKHFQLGRAPVIILDEAQGLSTAVLEEVRMLLNHEIGGESLVRIVLAGQPELDLKLHRPELRQLRQRIMIRCRTAPLSLEDTYGYIQHRLRVAGSPDGAVFSREAMDAVYFYSGGIPRVMNLICEHSLINAYSDGVRPVQPQIVESVAWEFRFDEGRPLPTRSSVRPVAEVIPMDSSPTRMRMSALQMRESAPIEGPAVDSRLLAELMKPSSFADAPVPPASAETVVHQMAVTPEFSLPKNKVELSASAPPVRPPIIANPVPSPEPAVRAQAAVASAAPSPVTPVQPPIIAKPAPSLEPPIRAQAVASVPSSSAPPVRPPTIASPQPSQMWDVPRPVANMSWSRSASVRPIKLRLQATSALLEASVTRIVHKLDELKPRLQHLAGTSIQWLRQPMGAAHSHRTPAAPRQKR
ncbi:MAG TPA: AAA family ATPase [Candidatus Acidoferrales bacterium]